MRILVDLQPLQGKSRTRRISHYTVQITKALIQLGGDHEFILFVTDCVDGGIEYVRQEFKGLVPPQAIVVCSLDRSLALAVEENAWRTRSAELMRAGFIAAMKPDVVFVPADFAGIVDDTVMSIEDGGAPTVVALLDLIPIADQTLASSAAVADACFRRLAQIRRADRVVVTSALVAEDARTQLGFEDDRLAVVASGFDDQFQPHAGADEQGPFLGLEQINLDHPLQSEVLEGPALDWNETAGEMFRLFEAVARDRTASSPALNASEPAVVDHERIAAIICDQLESDQTIAGRIASLIDIVGLSHRVILVSAARGRLKNIPKRDCELRGMAWFEKHAGQIDQIIYVTDGGHGLGQDRLMSLHPGIVVRLKPGSDIPQRASTPVAIPQQRHLTVDGEGVLLEEGADLPLLPCQPLPLANDEADCAELAGQRPLAPDHAAPKSAPDSALASAFAPQAFVPSPAVRQWRSALRKAGQTQIGRKQSLLRSMARDLPATVRGCHPEGVDLDNLAEALVRNLAYERAPLTFIDVSAFWGPGGARRMDRQAAGYLLSLLDNLGAVAIREKGGQFYFADSLLSELVEHPLDGLRDDRCAFRAGDRIIGLDLFQSFQSAHAPGLKRAAMYGVQLGYFAVRDLAASRPDPALLWDLLTEWLRDWGDHSGLQVFAVSTVEEKGPLSALIKTAQKLELPLSVFATAAPAEIDRAILRDLSANARNALARILERKDSAWAGEAMRSFAVMGHILGSYSLAIINRNVANTLEEAYPGAVRFLPFETDPIDHTEGVPRADKETMQKLIARPAIGHAKEVTICQHWPIMAPRNESHLALALFPWEETQVPEGVLRSLTEGFDGLIAPSAFTADALINSGYKLPIGTIGQPVDLRRFEAIAATRPAASTARRFLHISSCFPRKGVDVLLRAWAQAFTRQDNVELVIKTFPNPHNDVEQQVAELGLANAELAPIRIINQDIAPEDLVELYQAADAVVLPTRGEGYNLPALEAMAAGIPLIVTGNGGHRDFCGPDQARLIDYRYAFSNSHVAGEMSLWLEPDVADLVKALKEFTDPAQAAVIEQRRQSSLAAAKVEGDRPAWVMRLNSFVDALDMLEPTSAPKVSWVTTWGVECGIAQYSGYLINHLSEKARANTVIKCDLRTKSVESDDSIQPVWSIDIDSARVILDSVIDSNSEAVIIQHQDGLISWDQMGEIGHDPRLAKIASLCTLHNARNLRRVSDSAGIDRIISGLGKFSRILVHNIDDMNFLRQIGLDRNVGLFPHGAFSPEHAPWPRRLTAGDEPVIGCHGFFFRHKGIDKLIVAASELRKTWPGLKLRLVNACKPGEDHDRYFTECERLVADLGMEDSVEFHTDFLPVEEIERLLGSCDLNVLAYDESDESASGAVRTCLATMVPLVATKVNIFREFAGILQMADSNSPDDLVKVIKPLLESPRERRELQANIHEWLRVHDWERLAGVLENMIASLVWQKRGSAKIWRN